MTDEKKKEESRPDLSTGIAASTLADGGMLVGRVGDDEVVLARSGDELFAIGAHCTHYHGPLADGVIVGDTVRCPWHHACFSLRTGEALRAPALDAIDCWRVERQGDRIVVREKASPPPEATRPSGPVPESILIVGGGAAGLAAAGMARRRGYGGAMTIISADPSAPVDRPNLSKDYLAGNAQDDWIPLRSPEWYAEQQIGLLLDTPVASIDPGGKRIVLKNCRGGSFGVVRIVVCGEHIRV